MISLKLTRWIIVASFTWVIGYTFNRYHEPEVQWIKSIYEAKVERERSTEAPRRLLIVGGSGTHFGVNALQIERDLGIPVFNMGLHAGLGLNAILASVSGEIRSGDIVLLISEYGLVANNGTGYYSSSFGAAMARPGIGGVGSQQVAREILLMGVPGSDRIVQLIKRFQRSLSSIDTANANTINRESSSLNDNSYSSNNIDERGSPLVLPSGNPQPADIEDNISEYALLRIKAFSNQIEATEATLVLGLPWVLVKNNKDCVQTVQEITSNLAKIAPVVHDEKFNLKTDSTLFGDTNYHLSPKGRELRSSTLAQQLKYTLNLYH